MNYPFFHLTDLSWPHVLHRMQKLIHKITKSFTLTLKVVYIHTYYVCLYMCIVYTVIYMEPGPGITLNCPSACLTLAAELHSATGLLKDLVCSNTERKGFIQNVIWKHTGTVSADKTWSLLPTRWEDLKPVFPANQSGHSASLISPHAIILLLALFARGWGLGKLEIYSFCFPAWKQSNAGDSVGKSLMVSYFTTRHSTAMHLGF